MRGGAGPEKAPKPVPPSLARFVSRPQCGSIWNGEPRRKACRSTLPCVPRYWRGSTNDSHVRVRDVDSPASSRAISTNARSAGDTADEKRNRLILDDVVQALQQGRRLRRVRSRSPPGSRCSTRNLTVPFDTTVLGVQITLERVDLDRSEQIVSASLTAAPETHASRSSAGVPRPAQQAGQPGALDRSKGCRRNQERTDYSPMFKLAYRAGLAEQILAPNEPDVAHGRCPGRRVRRALARIRLRRRHGGGWTAQRRDLAPASKSFVTLSGCARLAAPRPSVKGILKAAARAEEHRRSA